MSGAGPYDLSIALLKACGIDNVDRVQAVTYRHAVNESPRLRVTYLAPRSDGEALESFTYRFRVEPL